ncbi:MAG: ThuA domain-containing protein [Gemmataceae bacterium]
MTRVLPALVCLALAATPLLAAPEKARKKIVLIAGKKSHGPVGNGIHDYGWSVQLLRVMLEHSNIRDQVRVEHHLDGWPKNPATLEDADTILIISDGRDGNLFEEAPHLASPERVRLIDRQIKRGCGFMTFHFSTFAPNQYAAEVLGWCGGYFQWEQEGKRQWYSAITTKEAQVELGAPNHPMARGLKPFKMREEFYYNLRFPPEGRGIQPLWVVPALNGRKPDGNVVAWAREREDGGRGFGTTCGHFYDNWKHEQFRRLILNALAWTARVEVPEGGVQARFFTHEEIKAALGQSSIRLLLVAGNEAHKWHNWEKTTPRIKEALERDNRVKVDVVTDFEELGRRDLTSYQGVVMNWCNWQDPRGASEKSRQAFSRFVSQGGGLILIHFANGAFHPSLPRAGESDWPEYRKIVRRVWNHQKRGERPPSGHDAFGKFSVRITRAESPLTTGLKGFDVVDELYFHQDGEDPIEPLLAAESKVTRKMEPLAWSYTYGKGRVFQTVLGHSEKTYDAFEVREVLRRAAAWVVGQPIRPLEPASEAKR